MTSKITTNQANNYTKDISKLKYSELVNKYGAEGSTLNTFGINYAGFIASRAFGLTQDDIIERSAQGNWKLKSVDERAAKITIEYLKHGREKCLRRYKEDKLLNLLMSLNDPGTQKISEKVMSATQKKIKGYTDATLNKVVKVDETELRTELFNKVKRALVITTNAEAKNLLERVSKQYKIEESDAAHCRRITNVISVPLLAIATLFQGIKTIGKAVLSLPVELFCKLFNTHSNRFGITALKIEVINLATFAMNFLGCFASKKSVPLFQDRVISVAQAMFWEFTETGAGNRKGKEINVGSTIKGMWEKLFPPTYAE